MEEEFNLSEKIQEKCEEENFIYSGNIDVPDVKEFIKKVKEEMKLKQPKLFKTWVDMCFDKYTGEELK